MLLQRENQRLSVRNGTTRFAASWPMSARPPNGMPERAHHCSTIAASSVPKSGSLGSTSADPPEAQAPDFLNGCAGRHMEHRPVDPIEMLADVLDQQVDAGEVRLERGAQQVGQHRQVERHRRTLERGLQRGRIAPDEPIESAPNRGFTAVTQHILRHRPPRDLETRLVEAGVQESGIAVAEIELARAPRPAGRRALPRRCDWSRSRRARTTPRRSADRP